MRHSCAASIGGAWCGAWVHRGLQLLLAVQHTQLRGCFLIPKHFESQTVNSVNIEWRAQPRPPQLQNNAAL